MQNVNNTCEYDAILSQLHPVRTNSLSSRSSGSKGDSPRDSLSSANCATPPVTTQHDDSESCNVYVASLPSEFSNDDLQKMFSKFGDIVSAKTITDYATKQCKGFGFVLFKNATDAAAAIKAMNGARVNENRIQARLARPTAGATPSKSASSASSPALSSSFSTPPTAPVVHAAAPLMVGPNALPAPVQPAFVQPSAIQQPMMVYPQAQAQHQVLPQTNFVAPPGVVVQQPMMAMVPQQQPQMQPQFQAQPQQMVYYMPAH